MKCEKCGREYDGVCCPACGEKSTQPQSEQFSQEPLQEQTNYGENTAFDTKADYSVSSSNSQSSTVNGLAVGSMVCGIISLILIATGLFAIILGIIAIVLHILSKKSYGPCGMATAGFVTGLIGLIIGAIIFIVAIVWVSVFATTFTSGFLGGLM